VAQELVAHNDAKDVATTARISLVRIGVLLWVKTQSSIFLAPCRLEGRGVSRCKFRAIMIGGLLFFIEINVLHNQQETDLCISAGCCKLIRQC
jgi:hypothetical protein